MITIKSKDKYCVTLFDGKSASTSTGNLNMDSNFIKALGKLQPVTTPGSSFAVSNHGDIVIIDGEGTIRIGNVRKATDSALFAPLLVANIKPDEIQRFTHIDFNAESSIVLLWSSTSIGFIEIPVSSTKSLGHNSEKYIFTEIFDDYSEEKGTESASPIVKACFHPLNPQYLVVLNEREQLRLIDLRDVSTKRFSLPPDMKFASFCFGPAMDWMQFTLFLLTTRGETYALCPVIPMGTLVPRQVVNELWSWVEGQANTRSRVGQQYSSSGRLYIDAVKAYLFQTLGPPSGESSESNSQRESDFVRAGEYAHDNSDLMAYFELQNTDCSFLSGGTSAPQLQGPLMVDRGLNSDGGENAPPSTRNIAANDICTPLVRTGAAPVLVVSYGSAEVDVLLFDGQSSASGYIGPSWRPIDRHAQALSYPSPSLLLVETVTAEQVATAPSTVKRERWQLQPDPLISHCLHLTNLERSQSYLLSSSWLQRALEGLSDSHSAAAAVDEELSLRHYHDSSFLDVTTTAGNVNDSFYSEHNGATRGGDSSFISHSSAVSRVHKDERHDTEIEDDDDDGEEGGRPSFCIPVFVVTPDTVIGSSANQQQQQREQVCITGMAVLSDPLVGHVALFRTSTGLVSAVNLTVHTKLCELQNSLSDITSGAAQGLSGIKQELSAATSEENQRWRHSQQLVLRIAEGLRDMPVVENAAAGGGLTAGVRRPI